MPRGRRRGESGTREAILAAGRDQFARDGFRGATVREIAAQAGADAALVAYFFGSKAGLFAAAVEWPFDPAQMRAQVLSAGREQVGAGLVRVFVAHWDVDSHRGP